MNNAKKRLLVILLLALLESFIVPTVYAHPGSTDGNGGHTNHSTGEYHYHHGYSAHDHYDIDGDGDLDCPYDFDDKSNRSNSGAISSTQAAEPTSSVNNYKSNTDTIAVLGWIVAFVVYVIAMVIFPLIMKS